MESQKELHGVNAKALLVAAAEAKEKKNCNFLMTSADEFFIWVEYKRFWLKI